MCQGVAVEVSPKARPVTGTKAARWKVGYWNRNKTYWITVMDQSGEHGTNGSIRYNKHDTARGGCIIIPTVRYWVLSPNNTKSQCSCLTCGQLPGCRQQVSWGLASKWQKECPVLWKIDNKQFKNILSKVSCNVDHKNVSLFFRMYLSVFPSAEPECDNMGQIGLSVSTARE